MLNTNETVLTLRMKLNANKRAVVDSPLYSSKVNELCVSFYSSHRVSFMFVFVRNVCVKILIFED